MGTDIGVLTLPPELLGDIFSHVSEESPLGLGPSMFVCRTWHAIIVNGPTLWATITLDSRAYRRLIGYPPRGGSLDEKLAPALSFYKACIRRSKSAPLKITIDLEGFSNWRGISEADLGHVLTLFGGRTREHAPRWTEFVWKHNEDVFDTQKFLRCLPQKLPSLQRLTISQLDWYKPINSDDRQFPVCPNLQTLSLINFWDKNDQVSPLFQQGEYSSVKDLTLGNSSCWVAVDLRCMVYSPNIHTLTLYSFSHDISDECTITPPICVSLPHLRLLRLRGWVPNKVLSSIEPPDNLTVVVQYSDGPERLLDSIGTLSRTNLATKMTMLRLEWPDRAVNLVLLSDVFELLKSAPSLEVVCLSPRMGATLGRDLEEFKANHGSLFSICTVECRSLD